MINPQESIETRTLEKIKVGMRQYLDPAFLSDMEIGYNTLDYFGSQVAFEFRKSIWADKLSEENIPLETLATIDFAYYTWDSAWQLWKHNHKDSKLFGWIACKWPPVQVTAYRKEQRAIGATFNIKKYLTFPEFQPPPQQFGNHYRYVQTYPGKLWWE